MFAGVFIANMLTSCPQWTSRLFVCSGHSSDRCCFCPPHQANLNDSHNQMVVHWAGEKSNVIVALARDSAGASDPKSSSVSSWVYDLLKQEIVQIWQPKHPIINAPSDPSARRSMTSFSILSNNQICFQSARVVESVGIGRFKKRKRRRVFILDHRFGCWHRARW